jgi:uncharacterized membrane protein YhaH (DUF805 family)
LVWYIGVLKKYAVFTGRARRKEYWMFTLCNILVIIALAMIEVALDIAPYSSRSVLGDLYTLAVLLPTVGVGIRRLHDTGRSGWWLLLAFVPIVGLVLIACFAEDGQAGANKYGPNPKEPEVHDPAAVPPGWHPDPTGRHEFRYWDANKWTDHVSDSGSQSIDSVSLQGEAS